MKDPYRIVVADRLTLVRQGLAMRLALEPDLQVVGEVGDSDALLTALVDTSPNAVVLDVEILEASGDGRSGLERLRSTVPNLAIVLLALHASPQTRNAWLSKGADAMLLKQDTGESLPRAIRQAIRARAAGASSDQVGSDASSKAPRS